MNTFNKTILAIATGSLLSVGAQAAVYNNTGNTAYAGQPYIGIKAGQVSIDDENTRDIDDPTAYGVYGGYNFDPNFGVELEFMGSDDADFTTDDNVKGEYDVQNYGIYGTYRYYFPNASGLYGKGKLGVARTEVDADFNDNRSSDSEDDTSVAGGLGLGFSVNPNMSIEGEYALTGGDAEAETITIGAHLKF